MALPRVQHLSTPRLLCRNFANTSTSSSPLKLAYALHKSPSNGDGGPPIIFMHGLFGSKQNNRTMSKVLARDLDRNVYALDLRNHGESPWSERHDYTSMAEDVEAFVEEHGLQQPTLIGHSMGAKVAMTVALRKPSLLSALIPVDNSPIDAALKSDFGKYVQGMIAIDRAELEPKNWKRQADQILQSYEESLAIRQFLLTNLLPSLTASPASKFRIPIGTLSNSLAYMADFPFSNPDAVQYKGPTLFVRGTKSHYVANESLPVIGSFFPRFEVIDIDSGHWVVSENPQEFRSAVDEFLSRNTGKGVV